MSRIFIIIIMIMYFIDGVDSPPAASRIARLVERPCAMFGSAASQTLPPLLYIVDGVYLYCGANRSKHPLNTHKNRRAHIAYSFAPLTDRNRLNCAQTDMNA